MPLHKRLAKERTLLGADTTVTETIPEPQTSDRYICWSLRVPYISTPEHDHIQVELFFPKLYPFHAPLIRILPPAHILSKVCHAADGTMCVSGFLAEWSPSLTVQYIVDKVLRLLQNPNSYRLTRHTS
jgi:ubiquitin-protein ligase